MICVRLIFLFVPFVAYSQHADIVTVTAEKLVLKAGDIKNLKIGIRIKEGFHIQANKLKDESLIPTTLMIDTTEGLLPGKSIYPTAKKYKLEGADSLLDVYDGKVEILVPVRAAIEIRPGVHHFNAVLRYQACDAKRCFFPRSLELTIFIEVTR
jgi:hypothetical protein